MENYKRVATDRQGGKHTVCTRCGHISPALPESHLKLHLQRTCKHCQHGARVSKGHNGNRRLSKKTQQHLARLVNNS